MGSSCSVLRTMLKFAILACLLATACSQSVKECVANSAIRVNKVSLTPYPPSLSKGFTAAYDVDVTSPIDGNIDVVVKLQKKVGFVWITVPCTSNYGSCTYEDICSLMDEHVNNEICDVLSVFGLPCKCPWLPDKFTGSHEVPPVDLGAAGSLVSGTYFARVAVNQGGQQLACLEVEVKIKS